MRVVVNKYDDILLAGKGHADHDRTLEDMFKLLQRNGITLNKKKCVFGQSSVKFFGYVFSAEGVHPNPEKVVLLAF